jgi:hypothetical protein
VWTEQHNGWFLTDEKNELGGTSNAITLADAGIPEEQITNASTLFSTDYMATGNATWMVYVEGPDGFGCMTGGDDRSFFGDYCTN